MLSNTAVPREYGAFRNSVLAGEIPVCEEISMQMNIIDHLIESPDFYYDVEPLDRFIRFCENEMTLSDGGRVTLLPSFKLWAEDLLCWYRCAEEKYYNQRTRRFEIRVVFKPLRNKQYLIVGRGAAKSMYDSFIQAYFLTCDPHTTQQLVIAPTMKQSEEIMGPIRTAISRCVGPLFKFMTLGNKLSTNELSKQKLTPTKKGIENSLTNSLIEVKPMSVDKIQGSRPKVTTVDEWLSGDTREDVIEAVEQGASKNPSYIIVATSSEGTIRDSVGDSIKIGLMKRLRGEIFDPYTSIWYYRLDSIREVGVPELWMKANPNIGATMSYEAYEKAIKTMEIDPTKRSDILAKRFGIPVEGYTYFFTYEETELHQRQNFDGLTCSLGADLSEGDDFCAFSFLFPLGNNRFGVKTRAYVLSSKVNKLPEATQEKYRTFVEEGSLLIMESPVFNLMDVYDDLDRYIQSHQYAVSSFGYDPYNAASFVERWCQENTSYGVEKVIQGAKTESVPLGELKSLAEERTLIFDQELMKFAMGNAIAVVDNNDNRKLSKKRARDKIDSVAALLDAWVAFKRHPEVY